MDHPPNLETNQSYEGAIGGETTAIHHGSGETLPPLRIGEYQSRNSSNVSSYAQIPEVIKKLRRSPSN